MKMTLQELALAIEEYPKKLSEALSVVQKLEENIEKLEEQVEEEELVLAPVDGGTSLDEDPFLAFDHQLLEIDHELLKLDLAYERLRGEIELEYRRNPPKGDKVTEATVSAVVKSDLRLFDAKQCYIEKKHEKEKLLFNKNMERKSLRLSNGLPAPEPTSPKLQKLKEKLATAEIELVGAKRYVEEVRASISSYQLLVQVYTSGILK